MQTHHAIDPFFRRLFLVAIMVIALYLLYLMTPVIVPFLCAFILAYLFNPLVSKIARFMPRWLAIVVVYVGITTGVVLLVWWLVPILWNQMQMVWNYLPVVQEWYNGQVRDMIQQYTRIRLPAMESKRLSETLVDYMRNNYNVQDAQALFQQMVISGMRFLNNAGLVVLIPILMFYFLLDWNRRLEDIKIALPKARRAKIVEIFQDMDKALMSFVQGQLLVMILLGIIYAVQLQMIGLGLGLTIGMIAGIASFVPYLGFGIGFIAAMVAGVFQFGLDWLHLGMIVGAFMVGQAVEGYVLQPLLLGDKIGLSPLWVIFSVLAGAALMGFVGMLIALPVSAIINVLFHHLFDAYLHSRWYQGKSQYTLFD